MKRLLLATATATAAAFAASPAPAAILTFGATLTGGEEVPPVVTPGTGSTIVVMDTTNNLMRVQGSFSGLLGTTTASHIHCCQPFGTNAQVATQVPSFVGFPLGVNAGSFNLLLDMTQASSFNPAFITAHGGTVASARTDLFNGIIAGQSYLNIHTGQFPGGEIRGQLRARVPEPANWALMIAGFALIGGALRMRMERPALA